MMTGNGPPCAGGGRGSMVMNCGKRVPINCLQ